MSWLVTGASGRIGSALVERLAGEVDLVAAVRGSAGRRRLEAALGPRGRRLLADGGLATVDWDLTGQLPDFFALRRHGVRGIVHLAARTRFDDRRAEATAVNVEGALMAARAAAALEAPLLHISTAYVSGRREGRVSESFASLGAPRNAYEASKAAAEQALFAYARRAGLRLVCFRPGIVLSAEPRPVERSRPPAVGPLVHLRLLVGLDARRPAPALLRHPGDPEATLSLVDLDTVTGVLAQAVRDPAGASGVYHVVAERPVRVGEVAEWINAQLRGLRVALTGSREVPRPDRLERVALGRLGPFVPYLFGRVVHERRRLERDFDVGPGPSGAQWRGMFERHAAAWRGEARPSGTAGERRAVADYFERFLPSLAGRRLVPGLASLSESFTVLVAAVACWRIEVEDGVLRRVDRTGAPASSFHFETDPAAFLEACSGRRRPAQLFFEQRVRIAGDLKRALRTAAALEEFFGRFPYRFGAKSA